MPFFPRLKSLGLAGMLRHIEAFDHFGGCVQEIVYDNAKTTVLARDFEGRKILWNPTFWDFCRYYGFRAWAHRPYRAQTKDHASYCTSRRTCGGN